MINTLKEWGGLATRWVVLFVIVILGWANLENRVSNLEADTIGIPE